ncbi:hypothetical protein FJY94_08930 [Candidatus Kaiserbacteria bacterium]|nr:hypothetical protein [Candidatus Kaiserbacteria bacterium]
MEIEAFQHPDFVWTWKSAVRGGRASLWLPYFAGVKKIKGSRYRFHYNAGTIEADLKTLDFIMLYGATGSIDIGFLDALNQHRICLSIHRRNQTRPMVFAPVPATDDIDVLTSQILARESVPKATYIARSLIRERFRRMEGTIPVAASTFRRLAATRNPDAVRTIEANVTRRYWDSYYASLGLTLNRREKHPLNSALDAGSMFLFGILLRWLLFHKFSPSHGYLHLPSSYPSLPYDLMEPYRYIFEDAAAYAWLKGYTSEEKLTAATLARMKEAMTESVYVPCTRQTVRRKTLLHGVVLALRTYLTREVPRLVIPVEGQPKGGRPPLTGYTLPGAVRP